MPPTRVWIVNIEISDWVAHKLRVKHRVEPHQVREACLFDAYVSARWDTHRRFGLRLIVRGRDADGTLLTVYLRRIRGRKDEFRCLTARRTR